MPPVALGLALVPVPEENQNQELVRLLLGLAEEVPDIHLQQP